MDLWILLYLFCGILSCGYVFYRFYVFYIYIYIIEKKIIEKTKKIFIFFLIINQIKDKEEMTKTHQKYPDHPPKNPESLI